MLGIEAYNPSRRTLHNSAVSEIYYEGGYINSIDDVTSLGSGSTNETMDDNPGAGLTIDKYFYQPVGRAIERFALKIAIRLNIVHPSPAQIIRFLTGLDPQMSIWPVFVLNPRDTIDAVSAEDPTHVPGILSLVQQSQ